MQSLTRFREDKKQISSHGLKLFVFVVFVVEFKLTEPIFEKVCVKNEKIGFDELGINIPENCKNISNYATAKVTLDLSKYKDKSFTVDNFIVEGLSDEYTSDVTSKSISVTLIGEQADLDKIKASQITAVIDTSNASGKLFPFAFLFAFKFASE